MKAVVCRTYGGPECATLQEIAAPAIRPGCVRIRVEGSSASFASLLVMSGKHQNRAPLPVIAGTEVAGSVIELGSGVNHFRIGERVIASVQSGGYAQEVVAPIQTVFALPDDIAYDVGAQFPTIYATAYGALKWRANIRPGEFVLIHGAGGGSGLAAVEVAKALGTTVIATASTDAKLAAARAHGADYLVNYQRADWCDAILRITGYRGVNVIVDPVGGETFKTSLHCIAPEGRIILIGFASGTIPMIAANLVLVKNISVLGVYWGYYLGWGRQPAPDANTTKLRHVYEELFIWTRQGKLKPRVHATFPLHEFRKAFDMIASRAVIGRVILHPQA